MVNQQVLKNNILRLFYKSDMIGKDCFVPIIVDDTLLKGGCPVSPCDKNTRYKDKLNKL